MQYLEPDDGQVRNCAWKLCSWSQPCGFKDATEENCRERIKHYRRMADALAHINLSEHLTYFLANGTLMNIQNSRNCSSASIQLGLAPGPKPVWGKLEIELCAFILAQHKLHRQVFPMVVLHKVLQLNPQFC